VAAAVGEIVVEAPLRRLRVSASPRRGAFEAGSEKGDAAAAAEADVQTARGSSALAHNPNSVLTRIRVASIASSLASAAGATTSDRADSL
jgi:hypothetical protein